MSLRPLVLCLVPFLAAFGSCEERNLGSLVPDDEGGVDGGGKDAGAGSTGQGGAVADAAASAGGSAAAGSGGGDSDAGSMLDCPSVASSCPTGCMGIPGARFDQSRMCFDYDGGQSTLACVPEGSPPPPPTIVCARRVQDGAIFLGDPRLPHMPGWAACDETMALTTCPPALPFGIRVELSYGADTGKKGVTLRWQDGAAGSTSISGTFALLDRRFATFDELAAWKGSYEIAVAGKVIRTEEVSNWPCHDLASTLGYDERGFHVSRLTLEIAADGQTVSGQTHTPFDAASCYRALEAGAPAFGAVDPTQRVLRYWVSTKAEDLCMVIGDAETVVLPERIAVQLTATNADHYGLSFALASPLATPAANVLLPLGLKTGSMRFGIEGRFDRCEATRSDLYLQERDLLGDPPLGFDPSGRITCCTGTGCSTAVP
jgi:hypothetical protein